MLVVGRADSSPLQRSQGMRLVAALCRGRATPAMIYEFAAEMERRGERADALEIEQVGDRHLDRLRRMNTDPPTPPEV